MEKLFIPYEESLELKELGFDEPCFGIFNKEGELRQSEKNNHNLSVDRYDFPIYDEKNIHHEGIRAPLYQQAFRWFREKHNLDSFVKHLYKSTIKVGYYFGIDEYKGVEFQMDIDDWYDTHEEAELECLKKLIEIVKTKYGFKQTKQ